MYMCMRKHAFLVACNPNINCIRAIPTNSLLQTHCSAAWCSQWPSSGYSASCRQLSNVLSLPSVSQTAQGRAKLSGSKTRSARTENLRVQQLHSLPPHPPPPTHTPVRLLTSKPRSSPCSSGDWSSRRRCCSWAAMRFLHHMHACAERQARKEML